jgi:hypothetical protein
VILLQVPKGAGGARIHTAAVTAAVTGTTILMEAGPGYSKFIVLEGTAHLTASNDKFRRKTAVKAGQAVIMPNSAKQVPPPVFINIGVLVKTSRLISGTWAVELNTAPITTAIAQQTTEKFTDTNLAIIGPGTDVVFLPEAPVIDRMLETPPRKTGSPATIAAYAIRNATKIKTDPVITTGGVDSFGKIYQGNRDEDGTSTPTEFVFGSGTPPQPEFDKEFKTLDKPAVFRFESLKLEGGPDIDSNDGPRDLVLASLGPITSGGAGTQDVSLSSLDSLTLAALGKITLDSDLTFSGSSSRLWLSNHGGANDITVNSAVNLAGLRIDSEGNLSVGGKVNVRSAIWSSRDLRVTAEVKASDSVKIQSSGDVEFRETITTPSFNLRMTGTGLLSGAGTIRAERITVDSDSKLNLSQVGGVNLSEVGIATGSLRSLELTGGPLSLTGSVDLSSVDVTLNGTVEASAGTSLTARNLTLANLTAPGSLTLDAATGTLTLGGILAANDVFAKFETLAGTGSIEAGRVNFSSSNPLALEQSAELSVNGLSIGLGQLQLLDLTAGTIGLTGIDVPGVNLNLAGTVTGTSLSGRNVSFMGPATFSGDVIAANAFSTAGTFIAGRLRAKTVSFPNAKFSPGNLSQTGNDVIFNGLPIQLAGMTQLVIGGSPLATTGDISLGAANVVLAGTVIPGGNISASILTLDDLAPMTENVIVSTFDGPLTIRGGISGTKITLNGPTIDLANGLNAANLNLLVGNSQKILLGGTVTVNSFDVDARDEITSANANAKLDAEIVSLFLFGNGTDGTLSQTGSTAFFNNLELDLSRTTTFQMIVGGDMTMQGSFASGPDLANLELRATGDVFLNGNLIGDRVGARADSGSISVGGKISALRDINLFAGTNIIDTSGLPANEDHLSAGEGISLTVAGSSANFTQISPTRVGYGPLRLDVSQTDRLTLEASPLQVGGTINLPSVDLILNGTAQAPANVGLTARNLMLADFTTPGSLTLNAPTGTLILGGNVVADRVTAALGSLGGAGSIDARDVFVVQSDVLTVSAGKVNGVSLVPGRLESLLLNSFTFTNYSGDLNMPNLSLTHLGPTLINGNIRVREFTLGGAGQFSGGTVDADSLSIDINSPGVDGTFTKSGASSASFNALTLDLTRTTNLGFAVIGNLTANVTSGFTNNPTVGFFGRDGVQINGDLAVGSLDVTSPEGSIAIGGKIDALREVNLFAGTNILDTSGLPADQDHISAQQITIQVGGGPVVFSQSAPTRVGYGPLRLDLARTTDLTLSANPTQIVGDISLPGITLTVDGVIQASANNSSAAFLSAPAAVNGSNLTFDVDSLLLGSNGGIQLSGGDAETSGNTGSGGTLSVNARSNITANAPITATTGRNADFTTTGGAGGTVDLTSNNGTIAVNSAIEVSSKDSVQRRKSAKGGNIRLTSKKTTGTAIKITSSGDLKALLDAAAPGPGGTITFISDGGDILVNGGKLTADRGTIDVRNNGGSGLVHLTGASLAADVVKIGALGENGVLRIGGGVIDANTTIKLYAGGGNGTVDFVDDVSLSGSSVKSIAARTVNISNGKTVTVSGPSANVYTTNANYTGSGGNGSKTGTFAGSGAKTFPHHHPGKPPF